MDPLTCDDAREALWPDPVATDHAAARAHYAACAACQRFFAWQAVLGARLARLRPMEAPALVRGRLRMRLGAATAARRRRPLWAAALLAAALLIAALTLAPASPMAPFAPAAHRLAAMPMESVMVDRMEASAMLSARLSMPLILPDIEGADFMGADLVPVDGAMWAGARYQFKGMTVAYFALPMDGMDPDSTMTAGREGRWEVAMWEEPDGMRVLAAEVPITRDEVMALASECRNKSLMRPRRS